MKNVLYIVGGMALAYKVHIQGGGDNTALFPYNRPYISSCKLQLAVISTAATFVYGCIYMWGWCCANWVSGQTLVICSGLGKTKILYLTVQYLTSTLPLPLSLPPSLSLSFTHSPPLPATIDCSDLVQKVFNQHSYVPSQQRENLLVASVRPSGHVIIQMRDQPVWPSAALLVRLFLSFSSPPFLPQT